MECSVDSHTESSLIDPAEAVVRVASLASLQHCSVANGTSDRMVALHVPALEHSEAACSFLVASITKPIVAMAALRLAAEGEFHLVSRIGALLPEFRKGAYRRITVRHLLTHTSGFPDMVPGNTELRRANAPLDDFLAQAASTELDFSTGTDCRYSSIGFLLLGTIVERVTEMPLRDFLHREFFAPLEMSQTWLGLPDDDADSLMSNVYPSVLPDWMGMSDHDSSAWNWNSRYWRTLGAPWGGLMSSAEDLGNYAQMLLSEGTWGGRQIMPAAVVRTATCVQTDELFRARDFVGPRRPWGYGWRMQWPDHSASFGDFLSPDTYGHWGATGTTMWVSPREQRFGVILTTTPYEVSQGPIQQISNVIASSPFDVTGD